MVLAVFVPAWVRKAFDAQPTLSKCEMLLRALGNRGTQEVWDALKRQNAKVPKRYRPTDAAMLARLDFGLTTGMMAPRSLRRGAKVPTQIDRLAIARSMASSARRLSTRMVQMQSLDDVIYRSLRDEFRGMIQNAMIDQVVALEAFGESPSTLDALSDAVYFVVTSPDFHLAMKSAAIRWAKTKQPLKRPNDRNAARLLFFRMMTHHFVWNFGKPMRPEILVLAESMGFRCDDVGVEDLQKLAPTSTQSRRWKSSR